MAHFFNHIASKGSMHLDKGNSQPGEEAALEVKFKIVHQIEHLGAVDSVVSHPDHRPDYWVLLEPRGGY